MTDLFTHGLQLTKWDWFVDNAVRQLLHTDFIDIASLFTKRQMAVVWPNSKPHVDQIMKELLESYLTYIDHYISGARPRQSGEFWGPDFSYKEVWPNPKYSYHSAKHDLWASKNFLLLCVFTKKLNEYATVVRSNLNPFYFHIQGKFLIEDNFGTHLGSWGSYLDPTLIDDFDNRIKTIDERILEVEAEYKE